MSAHEDVGGPVTTAAHDGLNMAAIATRRIWSGDPRCRVAWQRAKRGLRVTCGAGAPGAVQYVELGREQPLADGEDLVTRNSGVDDAPVRRVVYDRWGLPSGKVHLVSSSVESTFCRLALGRGRSASKQRDCENGEALRDVAGPDACSGRPGWPSLRIHGRLIVYSCVCLRRRLSHEDTRWTRSINGTSHAVLRSRVEKQRREPARFQSLAWRRAQGPSVQLNFP